MIERIKIRNFKSIRDADVRLRDVNILIGGNGAGKSNFIAFFDLLHDVYQQRLGEYMLRHGGVSRHLYGGPRVSDNIDAFIDFDNRNALYLRLAPSAVSGKAYIAETADYMNDANDDGKHYDRWHKQVWDRDVEESAMFLNNSPRMGYLRHDLQSVRVYHFHDSSELSQMRGKSHINDNKALRADGGNLASIIYRMRLTDEKSYCYLESVLRTVAPYFKRFVVEPDALDPQKVVLKWEANNSDLYFDSFSFSDGTIRFLALSTLLLQPERPKTIIVDEPELGLHPQAVQSFMGLVRRVSKTTQTILATQSPNLLSLVEPENVIVVESTANGSKYSHLNEQELSVWLEEYSLGDLWEKNLIGGQP